MRLPILAAGAALFLAGCAAPGVAFRDGAPVEVSAEAARAFVEVAGRIEPVAEQECRRRNPPSVDCDFRIVVDDRPGMPPNAFQMLDARGRPVLGVTVALILVSRNADELAFVISHEASHHILGHLARQDQVAAEGAEALGRIAAGEPGATAASIEQAREIGAALGARSFSKEWELEADALGAVLALRAGYDPVLGADFFRRIPDPGNRVLGSHPANAERIAVVEAAASGRIVP